MEQQLPSNPQNLVFEADTLLSDQIREKTINDLRSVQDSNVDVINNRLGMLKKEWDMDRALLAGASALVVSGTMLGITRSKRWLMLTGAAGGMLLRRALSGQCMSFSILRRFGIRTSEEITNERIALKMMRNDFEQIPQDVREMLNIAEK